MPYCHLRVENVLTRGSLLWVFVPRNSYSDWSCSFTFVPRWLQGSAYIQPPMDDRNLKVMIVHHAGPLLSLY